MPFPPPAPITVVCHVISGLILLWEESCISYQLLSNKLPQNVMAKIKPQHLPSHSFCENIGAD